MSKSPLRNQDLYQPGNNIENGEDVSLTQKQIIAIVVELKKSQNDEVDMDKIKSIIYHTQFAHFSLN